MRIDAHHHLWSYTPEQFPWMGPSHEPLRRDFLPAEFGQILGENGYDGSIVVQARQSLDETRFLLETARSWSFIKGVVGWVDLRSPALEQQLDEFAADPRLVGVRHVVHDEPDQFLASDDVRRGLGVLERRRLVYELLLFPKHLRLAAAVVDEFPQLLFVLDHLGKPMEGTSLKDWRRDLEFLAKRPGVVVKLSGLFSESSPSLWSEATIRYVLDAAFDLFGPSSVMAASNWPVSELAGSYPWAMSWTDRYLERFPDDIREQVLGGNAVRVYGLDRR